MAKENPKKRIHKLRETISRHQKLYHTHDMPEISDEAYDSLVRELEELEREYPEYASDESPIHQVGGEVISAFQKVEHKVPQWSYDNIFNEEELLAWTERVKRMAVKEGYAEELEYVTELKFDGLKVILTYENGMFVQGATRGDGKIGEDITHNLRTVKSIPEKLSRPLSLIVVGEAWMKESGLQKLNLEREKEGLPLFANPRNAAAGSLRQLDANVTAKRDIQTYIYSIDYLKGGEKGKTQIEDLKLLEELGFQVNKEYKLCRSVEEIQAYYASWEKKKEKLDVALDGVVIKVNAKEAAKVLGYTAKAPRFGIAYKFKAEEVTTVVESIEVQVGRTGALTPVAHLSPVRVAGSVVSRATLHNQDEIERLGLKIGDTVVIKKAGDVIPEVVRVLTELRTGKENSFAMPDKCTICGGDVEKRKVGAKDESAALYCANTNCFAQEVERMIHFVSKKGMNIVGLGDKIVEKLIQEGLVSEYADWYNLKPGDLETLPKFGIKSAEKLIASIDKSRKVPLHRLLYALGILHVGEETARILSEEFNSLQSLQEATLPQLIAVSGIGDVVAESVHAWFKDKENNKRLQKVLKEIIVLEPDKKKNLSLKGKTFVLTGTLDTFSRDEAKAEILSRGGKVASSVSASTDYLVAGENAGSKLDEAKKQGTTVLNEDAFKKLL